MEPNTLKPSELAQRAFNRIKEKENWLQGRYAEDKIGLCHPRNPEACKFCSIGALLSENPVYDYYYGSVYDALLEIAKDMHEGCENPMWFNDNHTHETVCEMWEKTIDSLKSKGL